jgi:hypothetical protein
MKKQASGKIDGVISICVKCSDMFSAHINVMGQTPWEYSGYVPNWFPDEHYGDYVMLDIDLASGRIINWKRPTQEDIDATKGRD